MVSMVSDPLDRVDIVAFEMTYPGAIITKDDIDPVLFDNAIGFDDFRNTTNKIDLASDYLEDYNSLSLILVITVAMVCTRQYFIDSNTLINVS
jgi:hypothetical protein